MFFKLSLLTSNNVIWVNFSTILFDETQHVIKTSTMGYVAVCYEVINLFIKPQIFLFMSLYLIVTACDGLLMLSLDLFNFCIKSTWYDVFQDVLLKRFTLFFLRVYNDIKGTSKQDENIMILSIFPRGVYTTDPPSA